MSGGESSDEENFDEELLMRNFEEETQLLIENLLPEKSKESYIKAYDNFIEWKTANGADTANYGENIFLVYFEELSKTIKPPSLWSIWSKLEATLNIYGYVNLADYEKLRKYLSNKNKGYRPKQSNTLSLEQIKKFLTEADNKTYLAMKAMIIVAFFGCMRCQEILNLKLSDFEETNNRYIVTVTETKTYITRNFVISREYYSILEEYRLLRPKELKDSDRFVVTYYNGKCTRQFIGKNKISEIPRIIANFLELPDSNSFTGHCYRRRSATALSHAGANLTMLKYHGGWKSDKVAQSYVDSSKFHREKVFDMLANSDPKNHFIKHPPVRNIFVPSKQLRNSMSTNNKSVYATTSPSNLNHSSSITNVLYGPSTSSSHVELLNKSSNVSYTESTSKEESNEVFSNLNSLSNSNESNSLTKTAAPSKQPSSSTTLSDADNFQDNNLASLSDGYDDVLAHIALGDEDYNEENENKTKGSVPQKTEQKEKQDSNIQIGEPCSKKVKFNQRSEIDVIPKVLFQNCEIHTININNDNYYSLEK